MTDFREKLRRGLEAHDSANAAKREINSVIAALNEAVERETDGRVGVKIIATSMGLPGMAARIAALSAGGVVSPVETEHWIVAFSTVYTDIKPLKLSRWDIDDAGYPCTLRFAGERLEAYDRESLENALGEMLEYTETGGAISAIIQQVTAKH